MSKADLNRLDVPRIAKLSRLTVHADELSKVEEDLHRIIALAAKLREDKILEKTQGLTPMFTPLMETAYLREDVGKSTLTAEAATALAAEAEDGYFITPKVME